MQIRTFNLPGRRRERIRDAVVSAGADLSSSGRMFSCFVEEDVSCGGSASDLEDSSDGRCDILNYDVSNDIKVVD